MVPCRHLGTPALDGDLSTPHHHSPTLTTMRGAVFLAVIALCALTDEVSAVARAGGAGSRAGKSKGSGRRLSNGSNAGGDRHRPGETTAVAAGLKRDKTEAPSHDGAHVNVRDQSAVVIGAIREERGRQVKSEAELAAVQTASFMSFLCSRGTNGQKSCAAPYVSAPPGRHPSVQPGVRAGFDA